MALRIFPISCVSRINGLKQIRNRLNEVPLVKQKSNYMIGNCNNLSQASACGSQGWLRFPLAPAVNAQRQKEMPRKEQAFSWGRRQARGSQCSPRQFRSTYHLVSAHVRSRTGPRASACLHPIVTFLRATRLQGKDCH